MRRFLAIVAFMVGLAAAPFAAQARVDIRVDLNSQTMHVRGSDGSEYRWAISSGKRGHRTPNGVYGAKRLAKMHYSRKYDNAPMPNSIFFRGGYAIHGTNAVRRLGSAASHGCIRLAPGNAAKLFAMVKESGARIAISGSAPGTDGPVYAAKRSKAKYASAHRIKRAPAAIGNTAPSAASWAIDAPSRGEWQAPRAWRLR